MRPLLFPRGAGGRQLALLPLLLLLACSGCPAMGQVLRLYGYTEIRPPSLLLAPGTMVWVQSAKPFRAGVICTQAASLGPRFVPASSPTASAHLTRATHQAFSLDADFLKLLQANVKFSQVRAIRVKLDNPVLLELNDVDVLKYSANRSSACRHALALRQNAGFKVTMIASALRADVTYTVQWSRDVAAGVGNQTQVLQELALALGVERSSVSEHTISARELFWGIKDDMFLAHLSEPRALQEVVQRRAALGPLHEVLFAPEPDVGDPLP